MFEDFCVVFGNNHSRVDACPMLLHASFKLGGKKARDLDLTRRCHLGITIPDSVFYSSMDCGITWGRCLLQHRRDSIRLVIIRVLKQLRSTIFQ